MGVGHSAHVRSRSQQCVVCRGTYYGACYRCNDGANFGCKELVFDYLVDGHARGPCSFFFWLAALLGNEFAESGGHGAYTYTVATVVRCKIS